MTDLLDRERYPAKHGGASMQQDINLDFPSMDSRKDESERLKKDARESAWQGTAERDAAIEARRKQHIREFAAVTAVGGFSRLEKGMGYTDSDADSLFAQVEKQMGGGK
jgi:hypothetical protein